MARHKRSKFNSGESIIKSKSRKQLLGEISRTELARNIVAEFPYLSKRELGKILNSRHPILFQSDEDARRTVRSVTGASASHKNVNKNPIQTDKYKGPLSIPQGQKNDFSHYKVHGYNVGIMCDIHLPYHDFDAVTLALENFHEKKIDTLILDGDIIDCYQASDFVRDPTKEGLQYEIDILCHFIDDIHKYLPGVKIIYKMGNHEERWERSIMKKCPAIWGFQCFELPELIKIQYKTIIGKPLDFIDFVNHKRIIDVGKLAVVHGHEWRESTFSPVNPARGYFMRAKASVIGGDKHQTSEHPEPDIHGRVMGAWSIGCLCDLHPEYMPLNKWNLGFARVVRYKDDSFEVHNHKIINGRIA